MLPFWYACPYWQKKINIAAVPWWNILKSGILSKLSLMLLWERVGSLPMNLAEIKEKFHERVDERPIFILVLGSKLLDDRDE